MRFKFTLQRKSQSNQKYLPAYGGDSSYGVFTLNAVRITLDVEVWYHISYGTFCT